MEKEVRADIFSQAELSAGIAETTSADRKYTSENHMKKSSGHAINMWKTRSSAT